ncbi:hypothetical protein [Aquipuribacter nitratireducens]|uniref:Uncharacterized protein n=1 Tax=Aquipuribacter nitratireducens TaxID=650104 RepID=A0ABW0GS62_9MICO
MNSAVQGRLDPSDTTDTAGVAGAEGARLVFAAVLTALRGDAERVVADLFARDAPLPSHARAAALELHQCTRPVLLATYDRNPFQSVTIDPGDHAQWRALLKVAPYSKDLRLETTFTDLLASFGGVDSLRLRLRDEQADRVRQALRDLPAGLSASLVLRRPLWRRRP